jgi:hypothetical protein
MFIVAQGWNYNSVIKYEESSRKLCEKNIVCLNYEPAFVHVRTFPTVWIYMLGHSQLCGFTQLHMPWCWCLDVAQSSDQNVTIYGNGLLTPKDCELVNEQMTTRRGEHLNLHIIR